ncbi:MULTISPECIES: SDR family oxidoreductase [unclassified Pseudomonas]|uniref:SDR family oxidoreductase n=1 Tax=unclassified Pseudomonas TaxID=196821 RepID=UPI00091410E9|nr:MULTISPECIES: SDR family oxidoreductase [unclassified Pseudomonas]SFX60966.1 NAD(P)-dependent dehydrogenase, short-chain alcohol dehydrogenase family [Pseudomonas sp. NFACC47-1]SFY08953.1 NAD(P)-dependent dehydrogenase, short-chain alcohol dehydrogenase family [Pseudomonas sp. NFACC43]
MSGKFANRIAVVTGASTGIGFAIAQGLIAEGAKRVYITGRSAATLEAAVAKLGDKAVAVICDVARQADLDKLKATIDAHDDQLDSVFANAGICERNPVGETTEAAYFNMFDINVKGVFFTVQTLMPLLKNGASIVLTASICSSNGMEGLSLYNASKAAVRSFARTWANELKGRKIRTNVLSPGFTRTPLMDNGLKMSESDIAALRQHVEQITPLGYMAQPEEIASSALFLASADAKYVNGVELMVDGGLSQI